mmetsp:Transcript_17079/g.27402  ORF Transcript_17079/g.27402 Transcript_17079/m.27402 type:complete len:315 (-) Transcript_17079:457-1401(-)
MFLFWDWPPAISAMRSRSLVRRRKSSWEVLNSSSLCATPSFCTAANSSSLSACMRASSVERSSRVISSTISFSRRDFAFASFLRTTLSFLRRSSSCPPRASFPACVCTRSPAALLSVFFTTSTSSCISVCCDTSDWWTRRILPIPRSAIEIRASISLLLLTSCSRNRARSSSAACLARISRFLTANALDASWIASSRRFIDSTASSHCRTRSWRSACRARKSSAVLSSSIWDACVSVTSPSSSAFFACTCLVIFSMDRLSSLTRASSARWYFCSARLSSSFCRLARAHCSSSSWFQFINSLNWSRRSLPRCTPV